MKRQFARATIETGNGRRMPAYIACCSQCGHTEKKSANNHSGTLPPEAIANRFRNEGWFISNKEGKDICPKCVDPMKKPKITATENNVVNLPSPAVVIVEPPREMSKEDRRLVFAKLNEVYLDESSGYSSGWSDKRVASDLGVPQAWVRVVREENFGDEGLNEDARPLLEESKKILEAIKVEANIITERLEQAAQARAELVKRADHLAGRIAVMEKLFK